MVEASILLINMQISCFCCFISCAVENGPGKSTQNWNPYFRKHALLLWFWGFMWQGHRQTRSKALLHTRKHTQTYAQMPTHAHTHIHPSIHKRTWKVLDRPPNPTTSVVARDLFFCARGCGKNIHDTYERCTAYCASASNRDARIKLEDFGKQTKQRNPRNRLGCLRTWSRMQPNA